MKRIGAAVALGVVSVLLVGGAIVYGNSLSQPPAGAVVPAGVSAAALARYQLTLEPEPVSPLCDLHDWAAEHRVPLPLPLDRCPIARADAVRDATVQPKTPICPPGVMCAQLQGAGLQTTMMIAPHQDSVTDVRLVDATSPSTPALVGGRVTWAVSVNRVYQVGGLARTGAPAPYLVLVDASSGAIVLRLPSR